MCAAENNNNEEDKEHPSEPPPSPPDETIIKGREPPPAEPDVIIKMLTKADVERRSGTKSDDKRGEQDKGRKRNGGN